MRIFIISILAIANLCCDAQTRVQLTEAQFDAISINGKTISQIQATNGTASAVQALFGNPVSQEVENQDDFIARYNYNGFYLGFSSVLPGAEGRLTKFSLNDGNALLSIKGTQIKVGDNINTLGNFSRRTSSGSTKRVIYHITGVESHYLSVRFDPSTNLVTEIVFIYQG